MDELTNQNEDKSIGEKPVHLKRRIGILNGIAVICGLIIGSGIYVSKRSLISVSLTQSYS